MAAKMADVLSPFVYWGQNNQRIFLKVDLKDVVEPEVDLTDDQLTFRASGVGGRGRHDYSFELEFYLPIDPDESQFRTTDRHIEFQIKKQGVGECWPRLIVPQQKPAWLKIDFDHFAVDDDSDNAEENTDTKGMSKEEHDFMEKIEQDIKEAEVSSSLDMRVAWLFLYNMFQWVGYTYIFFALGYNYWKYGEESKEKTIENVGAQLMVCQLVACLEVLHPMIGLVKTGVSGPLMQVVGRNVVLFLVIAPESKLHGIEPVWWLCTLWSSIELIRYPFYLMSALGREISMLTWLRYTIWIPLYPVGFTLEVIVMLHSLPMFEASGCWSLELPNSSNMAFSFPLFLRVYIVVAIVGFWGLLRKMYIQRKKKLGSGISSVKAKAA